MKKKYVSPEFDLHDLLLSSFLSSPDVEGDAEANEGFNQGGSSDDYGDTSKPNDPWG